MFINDQASVIDQKVASSIFKYFECISFTVGSKSLRYAPHIPLTIILNEFVGK